MKPKIKEFLDEYNELTERHGLYIASELKILGKNMCRSRLKVVCDLENRCFESNIEWFDEKNKWVEESNED